MKNKVFIIMASLLVFIVSQAYALQGGHKGFPSRMHIERSEKQAYEKEDNYWIVSYPRTGKFKTKTLCRIADVDRTSAIEMVHRKMEKMDIRSYDIGTKMERCTYYDIEVLGPGGTAIDQIQINKKNR